MRDLDLDPKRYPPAQLLGAGLATSRTSWSTRRRTPPAARPRANHTERDLAEAYPIYQRRLRQANALDFDDLHLMTVNMLQAFPDVAEHYRRRFRHVLVDEYQDTNHAQYGLVGSWSAGHARGRTCRPASWRRRRRRPVDLRLPRRNDPQHRRVRERLPRRPTVLLEQNYRSTQTILGAANAVIARNERAASQEPAGPSRSTARSIVGYVADNEHDEARFVAPRRSTASPTRASGPATSPSSTGPTRSPACSRRCFVRVGLPYKVVGGTRFYERGRSRTPWPTCASSANPTDPSTSRRIVNVPKRGIGDRAEAASPPCCPSASGSRSSRRWRGPTTRPASRRASVTAIKAFTRLARGCATSSRPAPVPRPVARGRRSTETRLPRRAAREQRPAGREPRREPRRARRRRPGVRRGATRRAGARTASFAQAESRGVGPHGTLEEFLDAGLARRRRRRDPDGPSEAPGVVTAHDAAHRQGPRVPRRLPDRARGRRVPPHAGARRPQGARGGAPPRLRRHHPRPRAALPHPRRRALRVGCTAVQPAVALPRRDPGRPARLAAAGPVVQRGPRLGPPGRREARGPAGRAQRRQASGHLAPARATGSPTTPSASARSCASRARATSRWRTSTSAPTPAPSASCCATPRSRSSEPPSGRGLELSQSVAYAVWLSPGVSRAPLWHNGIRHTTAPATQGSPPGRDARGPSEVDPPAAGLVQSRTPRLASQVRGTTGRRRRGGSRGARAGRSNDRCCRCRRRSGRERPRRRRRRPGGCCGPSTRRCRPSTGS